MIILFHLAPSRMLYNKYFSFFWFFKDIFWFFSIYYDFSRIIEGVYPYLFEYANTRKLVFEHSCSSVRVFSSILAQLAHLAQFIMILDAINDLLFWYMFKQTDIRKWVSEHSCSSVREFWSILAHLAQRKLRRQYFAVLVPKWKFPSFPRYQRSYFGINKIWIKFIFLLEKFSSWHKLLAGILARN